MKEGKRTMHDGKADVYRYIVHVHVNEYDSTPYVSYCIFCLFRGRCMCVCKACGTFKINCKMMEDACNIFVGVYAWVLSVFAVHLFLLIPSFFFCSCCIPLNLHGAWAHGMAWL